VVSLPSGTGRDVPLESLQQSQDIVTDTLSCSANTNLCKHKPEKDMQELSTQTEEPKNENVETVKQNEENSSSTEGIVTELILNVTAQQGNEEPVAIETKNSSVAEEVSCVTAPVEEAANEHSSVQGTSLNCTTVKPENLVNLGEYKLNVISNEKSENTDSVVSQTEKEFVANIYSVEEQEHVTESHTRLTEKREASEVIPIVTTTVNEGELKLYDQEYSPNSVINGQMPALIIHPATLAHDQELYENKNIPVATMNAATNTNHVSRNGAVEQIPVKVAGAEYKKGKVSLCHKGTCT
jgi:hypothetical protein